MRRSHLLRLSLFFGTLVLLLAPLRQTLHRHGHFTANDCDFTNCALVILATAGFWALKKVTLQAPRPARRRPVSVRAAIITALASALTPILPPNLPAPLRL